MDNRDLLAIYRCQVEITRLTEFGDGDVDDKIALLNEKIDSILKRNHFHPEDRLQVVTEAYNLVSSNYTAAQS